LHSQRWRQLEEKCATIDVLAKGAADKRRRVERGKRERFITKKRRLFRKRRKRIEEAGERHGKEIYRIDYPPHL